MLSMRWISLRAGRAFRASAALSMTERNPRAVAWQVRHMTHVCGHRGQLSSGSPRPPAQSPAWTTPPRSVRAPSRGVVRWADVRVRCRNGRIRSRQEIECFTDNLGRATRRFIALGPGTQSLVRSRFGSFQLFETATYRYEFTHGHFHGSSGVYSTAFTFMRRARSSVVSIP